jgi:hypothetical protein
MLAYRRVPLRQSIVIWSCGPWRSPWRVASTTWPRPLETCSSGVQWGDAAVSTWILTQVCLWWFGIFFHMSNVEMWSPYITMITLCPALRFLIFFGEFLAFLWPHLGNAGLHHPSGTSRAFNLEGGLGHHPPPSLEDGFFWGCSRLDFGFI